MIQVSGQVVDATTGGGIPSATISVNGKAMGSSDNDGNFTVNLDSYNDTISASSIGYVTLTQPAYQVQESGLLQLGINADSLQAVTVTPSTNKSSTTPWLILAGIAVVASSSKGHGARISGKGSDMLIPVALLGLGAYMFLKPSSAATPPIYYPTAPYAPTTPGSPSGGAGLPYSGLSSVVDIFKGLFGGSSSTPSYTPVGVQPVPGSASPGSPAGGYATIPITTPGIPINPGAYDGTADIEQYADEMAMSGIGATTAINAGDIIGKTLIAAQQVPLYDTPSDTAQPSGYVSKGNPIGIVSSYLSPDTSQGRKELWWMFEPLPGNSDVGDSEGFYYVPHNPDYFDTQSLLDSGVLTVAQATALKNGTGPSTAETLIQKYLPWVIGGLVAVGLGKAVINKAF